MHSESPLWLDFDPSCWWGNMWDRRRIFLQNMQIPPYCWNRQIANWRAELYTYIWHVRKQLDQHNSTWCAHYALKVKSRFVLAKFWSSCVLGCLAWTCLVLLFNSEANRNFISKTLRSLCQLVISIFIASVWRMKFMSVVNIELRLEFRINSNQEESERVRLLLDGAGFCSLLASGSRVSCTLASKSEARLKSQSAARSRLPWQAFNPAVAYRKQTIWIDITDMTNPYC